jgi:hypothetical protein
LVQLLMPGTLRPLMFFGGVAARSTSRYDRISHH